MENKVSLFGSPVSIEGDRVKLIPLEVEHSDELFKIAEGQNIWRWYPENIPDLETMRKVVREGVKNQELGIHQPFSIFDKVSCRICGSTRFFNADQNHRRVEIGFTWVGIQWQRTYVNTETKFLMLRYAFETLGCIRVELKTDLRNEKSQQAISRLGASQEGVLRNHMVTYDGSYRNTVLFSITDSEWPDVKLGLVRKIQKP